MCLIHMYRYTELSLRNYIIVQDTVRVFSNILVFIQRVKQHFQPKSYQLDLVSSDTLKDIDGLIIILLNFLTGTEAE